jgi:hypothetical protein
MTVYDLLILQFIAHMLADYTFQSELWVEEKKANGIWSWAMIRHVLVVLFISYVLANQWFFIIPSLIIAFSHMVIDGNKEKMRLGKYTFFIDQAWHLVIISGVVILFEKYCAINPIIQLSLNTHYLIIIAAFLFCTKPANILIKEIFKYYKIVIPQIPNNGILPIPNNDLLNAGKIIGIMERILTVTFVLLGQYEAVGFLIAAKSILRYEGNNAARTEYVLIGTLLSFGIAIMTSVAILKLIS